MHLNFLSVLCKSLKTSIFVDGFCQIFILGERRDLIFDLFFHQKNIRLKITISSFEKLFSKLLGRTIDILNILTNISHDTRHNSMQHDDTQHNGHSA